MTTPTSNADVSDSPEAETTAANETTAHESPANDTAFFTVPLADDSDDAETAVLSPADFTAAGMGPRTRWAAIVWGLLFAVIAAGTLAVVLVPERRLDLARWFTTLEPAAIGLFAALAVGTIVLLASLVGILRRAQRKLAQRRIAHLT